MISRRKLFLTAIAGALTSAGCHDTKRSPAIKPKSYPVTTIFTPEQIANSHQITTYPIQFHDITKQAGINWDFNNGATGHHYFIETTGGGVALFDYNNDGLLDILVVQGGPIPGNPNTQPFPKMNALYRNNGDGTYTDVTKGSGLDSYTGYGMGVSIADYDNDGWPDVYITAYGGNHLFKNNRNGTFTEVTHVAGVADTEGKIFPWPLSSAWGDFDNDGHLDLFICHYASWSIPLDKPCLLEGELSYCRPQVYQPSVSRLYHNNGDGTFTDITEKAGINAVPGKAMGAVWMDYDDDGWMDLFVTNDTMPNTLWHNNRNGTFTNMAMQAGVAVGPDGTPMSGMGIAPGDFFHNGEDSLLVVNFSGETKSVFKNIGHGIFEEDSYQSDMASSNLQFLGFGLESIDYDLDGNLDVVVGNGHVLDHIEILGEGSTYAQSQQLFHNNGRGKFFDDVHSLGDLAKPRVTRGLAVGDIDNDGDQDIVMVAQNGPLQVFRNDGGNRNNWLTIRLEGVHSNRDAIGAKVTIFTSHGQQTARIHGGSSYISHSDLRITFGLSSVTRIDAIEIRWPLGLTQKFGSLKSNHFYYVKEGGSPILDPRVKQPSSVV